jgi:predicted GIY-YIG superfamily endonuclease
MGYTSNLSQLILQHNRKHKGFTSGKNEIWDLLLSMEFSDKISAMKMEQYVKSLLYESLSQIISMVRK